MLLKVFVFMLVVSAAKWLKLKTNHRVNKWPPALSGVVSTSHIHVLPRLAKGCVCIEITVLSRATLPEQKSIC